MSRKGRPGLHPSVSGSAFDAPSEYGFVASDTPTPSRAADGAGAAGPHVSARDPLSILFSAFKLSLGVAVVASISVAIAWGAHRYALTTPRFAIREFEVKGNRHHSADQLARLAGATRGQNLFALDTDQAERKILESPWVRQAKVGRELPGTLRIEVVERDAVAAAVIEGTLYLVTSEGEPFKVAEKRDPTALPVLTGVGAKDLAVDRARGVERLGVGLEVLRDYQGLPLARVHEAEEVHLGAGGSVVLTIGQRGIALHLGKAPFRQKLLMAARILGKLGAGGQLPGMIFLDNEAHPERVVVRMR